MNLLNNEHVGQVLDSLFEQYQISDAVLSRSVRSLMTAHKYRQAANLLYAAIRNDQAEFWVYGALRLALEADHAPAQELERAILAIASFLNTPDERLMLAISLERSGLDKRALQMYCEVCKAIPHIAIPYRFAFRTAQKLNDEKALKELTLGVASQSWNGKEMQELWERGSMIADGLLTQLRNANRRKEADEYAAALREALRCDCIVFFEYAGDAEVDISVKEPANTICWFGNPQTPSGGVLGRNWLSAASKTGLKNGSYMCPTGFSGTYEVLVERIWGNVVPGNRVNVTVYTNFGTNDALKQTKTVTLDENGMALIRFQLKDGRRIESIDDAELIALSDEANRVRMTSQIAKAQTASKNSSASSATEKNTDSKPSNSRTVYQPRTLMVPSGTTVDSLDASTKISSAKTGSRKFVRVSPAANFQSVKKIVEFNMTQN
ncbi:MAG: hypothetical protein LBJ67_01180 [Planctomycetaceae bacterium]|jgi:hypothetical protein|nr:hypothetical protein [Planctomycetaceae bacterium]